MTNELILDILQYNYAVGGLSLISMFVAESYHRAKYDTNQFFVEYGELSGNFIGIALVPGLFLILFVFFILYITFIGLPTFLGRYFREKRKLKEKAEKEQIERENDPFNQDKKGTIYRLTDDEAKFLEDYRSSYKELRVDDD